MMSFVPILIFLLPGALGLTLRLLLPSARVSRFTSLAGAGAFGLGASLLLSQTARGTVFVHVFGGWTPPNGIVFVADRLSVLFLFLLSLLLFFAIWILHPDRHGAETVRRVLPVLWLLAFGLSGAFLTGDLFNLFVMFEVVLLSSYLLLQVPGGKRSLRAAFPNIAINLVGSLLFFVGAGVLYAATGTLNLADLANQLRETAAPLPVAGIFMLLIAFSIKSGLVPLVFWLPATYPVLSGPVAALFAGMMTKLGVYALLRTGPLLMQNTPVPQILVWLGAASALLGVLAALSEYEIRRLLGFHIVSQVGYMILGLGLMTANAVAGAIFYLIHHVLVKAALFFVADELERKSETRTLLGMKGSGTGRSLLAGLFAISAFSLAGLPPFSGFFAKIGLFRATLETHSMLWLCILVVASALTLVSMLKIWSFVFVVADESKVLPVASEGERLHGLLALVGVSLLLAVFAGPVARFAQATASQILDTESYSRIVLAGVEQSGPTGEEYP